MENIDSFKILQITDTHLFKNSKKLFGVDCNKNFVAVIDRIQQNEKNVDFILATGDISQDESIESYQFFMKTIETLSTPVYWLAGNHDRTDVMEKIFSSSSDLIKLNNLTKGNWGFIFVDTKSQNKDTGWISQNSLHRLETQLKISAQEKKSVALIMHHHPIPVNTPLIDAFILENKNELFDLLEPFHHVKLVLCGHVHNNYTIPTPSLTLETCPATCFQFTKGTTELHLNLSIGYKILEFNKTHYQAREILW